jgi:hypothetical protein
MNETDIKRCNICGKDGFINAMELITKDQYLCPDCYCIFTAHLTPQQTQFLEDYRETYGNQE